MVLIEFNRSPFRTDYDHKRINALRSCNSCNNIETYTEIYALVEFEDGTIIEVSPNLVKFLDSKELFEEYVAFRK